MTTFERIRYLAYGAGATVAALALAWFLNAVFERYWPAIALILLAMLIVTLVQRLVAGGIPDTTRPREWGEDDKTGSDESRPTINEEARELSGIDQRYAWMALPPGIAFFGLLIGVLV